MFRRTKPIGYVNLNGQLHPVLPAEAVERGEALRRAIFASGLGGEPARVSELFAVPAPILHQMLLGEFDFLLGEFLRRLPVHP